MFTSRHFLYLENNATRQLEAEPESMDEGVVEGKVGFQIWQPPKRSGNVRAARPTDFIYVCSLVLLVNYWK